MGWYEHELGWPIAGTTPPHLVTGARFDALEVPATVGFAALTRFPRPGELGPVALDGRRVLLLVAAGTAEELPGLLEWLEWSGIPLDLTALGAGDLMRAPAHPEWGRREAAYDRTAPVWLRPPQPGCEVEPTLPAMCFTGRSGTDGVGGPIGLVALVSALATACHRVRLLENQPCSFSYASRMVAGTRPRSLTS